MSIAIESAGQPSAASARVPDCGWFEDWKHYVFILPDDHYHSGQTAGGFYWDDPEHPGEQLEWEDGPIDGYDVHSGLDGGHTRPVHASCL